MESMTIDEAFEFLEVDHSASEKELKSNYHKKSKEYHPDQSENDHALQAKLNNAYEIANSFIKNRKSLMLVNSDNFLSRINTNPLCIINS